VDFSVAGLSNVSEVVVTGPASTKVTSLDDLSGKETFVRKSSSYYESLVALNQKFSAEAMIQARAHAGLTQERLAEHRCRRNRPGSQCQPLMQDGWVIGSGRAATRYDKVAANYLALIQVASIRL
jgi:hypothetical protein